MQPISPQPGPSHTPATQGRGRRGRPRGRTDPGPRTHSPTLGNEYSIFVYCIPDYHNVNSTKLKLFHPL